MSGSISDESKARPSRFTRRPGDEPIDGYRLVSPLGSGGFGEVWKCRAPGGMIKAMKIVTLPSAHNADEGTPAEQELGALSRIREIRHPFLVSIDRADQVAGELVIVMEMADSSLLDEFRRRQASGLPGIAEDELLHYLLEAAEVLDVMNVHHGLQHLDVKPGNILLSNRHVKLADFGLVSSVIEQEPDASRPLACIVTPRYASPELLQGSVSRFCDQYSLAIVYQELLTGTLPFEGNGLLKRLLKAPTLDCLPLADRPVVARALAPDPRERFPTCLEFVRTLIAARADEQSGRLTRVLGINSLAAPGELGGKAREQAGLTTHADDPKSTNTPTHVSRRLGDDDMSASTTIPCPPEPMPAQPLTDSPCPETAADFDACSPDAIYPSTIHVSDLRWKLESCGETAPPLDDFIGQLVAAATGQAAVPRSSANSNYREISGGVVEDWFMMPATTLLALRQKFERINTQCRGELISRSERSLVFAVETTLPFWKLFASKQRTLKTTVTVEATGDTTAPLFRVGVRVEPLIADGPSLDSRSLDVRSLLLREIRSVLQPAPDRRLEPRWSCRFGVRLYPILSDWAFDQVITGSALDLSAHGIGLTAPSKPATKRIYIRPEIPAELSEFAVFAEIVRFRTLPDGSCSLGAVMGRI